MLPLLLAVTVAVSAPADATFHPTRLLVKVKADASPREVETLHHTLGARVLRDIPQIRWQVLEVPRGRRDELRALYASETALFEHAELDRGRKPAYVPNDPMWPGMNHLVNIGADLAWNTERGDPSIVIGVIDTGLETTHPDLAANVWTNPGEIAGNGIDDDQNGYVDDVHGYDFAYNDPIPNDVFGHGTACAGIIAAVQDNNLGVTGIAPLCRIAGIKTAIDSGYLYDSANVPGMIYCADQGFRVISMSFYSDDVTLAERDAIDYCWEHDVVPVAAAGNDARVFPYYPAAYENVISVAALDPSLNKAGFSNWGTWVDVAAPGLSVSTTVTGGGYTTGFAGTSAACPHVAGVVALLRSYAPTATPAQIRNALENSCIPVSQAPLGEYTGYGRIWAPGALACLQAPCTIGAARFHFFAPCGGSPVAALTPGVSAGTPPYLAYGTHFDLAAKAAVLTAANFTLPALARNRNELQVPGTNMNSVLTVSLNNGANLFPVFWQAGAGLRYAMSDLGTSGPGGPVVTGAFLQSYARDGVKATVTARSDGWIYAEVVIRKVLTPNLNVGELVLRRNYVATSGTESIELYDWSTASFPYGQFVNINNTAATSGAAYDSVIPLPANPARFRDGEGTMYLRIWVSGASSGGRLELDELGVIVR
ncbi:MAG: S8 family serine peptidase [Planctomycetaceae bacterium]|nr:S8 family serine peptidase [Planctomycetaceae bacterium]